MDENHGIIQGTIFGFEPITSNAKSNEDSLEEHPGFKYMVEILNTKLEALEWWMQSGDITSNSRGLLWKHIEATDPALLTRAQLLKRACKWTQLIKDNKQLKESNSFLTERLSATEKESEQFATLWRSEKKTAHERFEKIMQMIDEKDTLCREVDELQREIKRLKSKI